MWNVASFLFRAYPDALQMADEDGNLPIHLTGDPGIARIMIDAFPQALLMKNNNGELPLHLACSNSWVKKRLILELIEDCPMSLRLGDNNGDLALHLSVEEGQDLEVVQLLTDKFPGALSVSNIHGQSPLHLALSSPRTKPGVVRFLIDRCPEATRRCDNRGQFPVHYAAREFFYWPSVLNCYDNGVRMADAEGRLPLHELLGSRYVPYRDDMIDSLCAFVDEYPEGLQKADAKGRLPLHEALANVYRGGIESGKGDMVIEELLRINPHAVRVADVERRLPLHYALNPDNKVPLQIIKRLIDLFPGSLQEGKALHAACASQARFDVIEYIANLDLHALLAYNNAGFTPLHVECMNRVSREVIEFLIRKCPETALAFSKPPKTKEKANVPSKPVPPLFLACERDASLDCILFLVKHSLDLFSPNFWAKAPPAPKT